MSTFDPNAELFALRCKVERWLAENGEYLDIDRTLAANNLTLWATAFLAVTREETEAAAEELRREGARRFVDRVRAGVCGRIAADRQVDPIGAVAQSFSVAAIDVLFDA